jgi:hypothetical protein
MSILEVSTDLPALADFSVLFLGELLFILSLSCNYYCIN